MIDFKDCSMPDLKLIDVFKPEPELDLIDFKDCSIPEPVFMDFSDPEPEFEYFFKPKTIETDTFLRICTEKPGKFIKEIGSQSTDRVEISLLPNFSKPESDLELIGFKDFPVPKPECINFSDPEPEFEYFSKPEAKKNDTFVRICAEDPNEFIKKNGSQSTDKVGIVFFSEFLQPFR